MCSGKMINIEEEKLKKIIRRVVRKQGFCDATQIIISKARAKGDSYLGEIVSISVKDELTQNGLKLKAKIAFNDEKVKDIFPYAEVFKNEILAYEKILPALLNLQIEADVSFFFNPFAKFYFASSVLNEQYFIVEDLRIRGFEMLGIRELLDHEHTKIICETYGKLHGLSFALKILQNEKFLEWTSELKDVLKIMFTEKKVGLELPKIWNFIRQVMKEKGYENERLNNYVENALVMMTDMCNYKEQEFSCFLQGDCWTNNMMFRHKNKHDHKEVEEIKLIDWQSCKIGLPVFDLSYSLFSGGSKEVLTNSETYLKIYHKCLSDMLSQFHLNIDSVYPHEEMKRQWKKYYHYGAILAGPKWKFRSFSKKQGAKQLNYTADDDSKYIDAISEADCDKDYLAEHMKELFVRLDEIC